MQSRWTCDCPPCPTPRDIVLLVDRALVRSPQRAAAFPANDQVGFHTMQYPRLTSRQGHIKTTSNLCCSPSRLGQGPRPGRRMLWFDMRLSTGDHSYLEASAASVSCVDGAPYSEGYDAIIPTFMGDHTCGSMNVPLGTRETANAAVPDPAASPIPL